MQTQSIDLGITDQVVETPARAHLTDGSIVVYQNGFRIRQDTLVGRGRLYGLTLDTSTTVAVLALDRVVGIESYRTTVNPAATIVGSLFGTAGVVLGSAVLAVAIFGSCPTFYADSAGTLVLEAEAFSYSIAPLFEARDVDRLRIQPGLDGVVRLEVRNEAAETHYINHLGLLVVEHEGDELVVPDQNGLPMALRELLEPTSAIDRTGNNVLSFLRAADEAVFSSDEATLTPATPDDIHDHIEMTFPRQRTTATDSLAVVFRLRNSLLTTVLLYEIMLEGQGAAAIDWIGRDLEEIGTALAVGEWYVNEMGLRVDVYDGQRWNEVTWVRDVGPIAWKDVGVSIPAPTGDSVKIRLRFVSDAWRIDRVMLSESIRRPTVVQVPLTRLMDAGIPNTRALAATQTADDDYLQTTPGQAFTAEFDIGMTSSLRTLLLATQGYYVEWMRPDWLQPEAGPTPFVADNARLVDAIARWRLVRSTYEQRFFDSRIPVR